eukprot:1144361-Prymnesium_polylepis.1
MPVHCAPPYGSIQRVTHTQLLVLVVSSVSQAFGRILVVNIRGKHFSSEENSNTRTTGWMSSSIWVGPQHLALGIRELWGADRRFPHQTVRARWPSSKNSPCPRGSTRCQTFDEVSLCASYAPLRLHPNSVWRGGSIQSERPLVSG